MADVVVIGAGLAGLTCAQDLARSGVECQVLEASDDVGGRVRTDRIDGYQLDRGFQILLTAYPEVRQRLDLDALGLGNFEPGALVRLDGTFHRVADPRRRPLSIPRTLTSPIGTAADKIRLLRLVLDVRRHSVPELLRRPETTTAERLAVAGFSNTMIRAFWQPLFAGIQLDPHLEVSSRRFETILKMLASGPAALPRDGMGAIPRQLADTLPPGTIRTSTPVGRVTSEGVLTSDGEVVSARSVVIATDGPAAHRLLGHSVPDPGSRPVACCWFSAPGDPGPGTALVLDGEASGPVKNLAVVSAVSPHYAPPGRALIAAAVPGSDALEPDVTARVRRQLSRWFDARSDDWTHLRTDVIRHGQPLQGPPFRPKQPVTLGDGLFVCGDHRDTASIQGAMYSGARTARAVVANLRGRPRSTPGRRVPR